MYIHLCVYVYTVFICEVKSLWMEYISYTMNVLLVQLRSSNIAKWSENQIANVKTPGDK